MSSACSRLPRSSSTGRSSSACSAPALPLPPAGPYNARPRSSSARRGALGPRRLAPSRPPLDHSGGAQVDSAAASSRSSSARSAPLLGSPSARVRYLAALAGAPRAAASCRPAARSGADRVLDRLGRGEEQLGCDLLHRSSRSRRRGHRLGVLMGALMRRAGLVDRVAHEQKCANRSGRFRAQKLGQARSRGCPATISSAERRRQQSAPSPSTATAPATAAASAGSRASRSLTDRATASGASRSRTSTERRRRYPFGRQRAGSAPAAAAGSARHTMTPDAERLSHFLGEPPRPRSAHSA